MKIAIMGAGLSGLSCALTLEKNGITPFIFEKRSQVGDRFVNCEILLSVLTRPITDQIAYLSEEYGLFLRPTANIRKLTVFSRNNQAEIEGQLGFTNLRGRDNNSFEKQLAGQLKTKIHFDSEYSYERLLREFTHVVVATGDAGYAARIQQFNVDAAVTLRGANVSGNFNRYTVMAWLNNDLAPRGYGYLIPISEKEANIVIGFPEYSSSPAVDTEVLWKRFFQEVCQRLNQSFEIISEFEVNNYLIGICSRPRIGNTFFTGNNFGAIMPFLGFGQFASLLTGIFAALDLCGRGNYQQLLRPLIKSYYHSVTLRRALEILNNKSLDLLVRGLNHTPGRLLFHLERPDLLKITASLLKPLSLKKPHPYRGSEPAEYQITEDRQTLK